MISKSEFVKSYTVEMKGIATEIDSSNNQLAVIRAIVKNNSTLKTEWVAFFVSVAEAIEMQIQSPKDYEQFMQDELQKVINKKFEVESDNQN